MEKLSAEPRRWVADEQYSLKCMFAAISIFERVELDGRFASIPYAKRDFALIKSRLSNLCNLLLETMPTEQLLSLSKNLKAISYTIGVKRPASQTDKDFGLWVSYDALNALMASAHDTCMMCSKNGKEQQSCPLRKGLNELPVEKINETKGQCPYYGKI